MAGSILLIDEKQLQCLRLQAMQKEPRQYKRFTPLSRPAVKRAARRGGWLWSIGGAVIILAILKAILSP